MINKIGSLLLALSLLLTLAACQPSPDPALAFSALELATAISNAAADAPDAPEQFDSSSPETLNAYIEAAYGLLAGEWEDCAVIMASGARAYEIAVLRFADEAAARHGAECLEQYTSSREGDFFGYAPEEAALVSNAVVCHEGLYVGLFICEDPEAARVLFISILNTGTLPEPTPTPEPKPEAEPSVDMLRLMVGIMESCIDEINALGGASFTLSFSEYSADYFFERVTADFDINADSVVAGFFVDSYWDAEEVFQIYVLCMTDETAAGQSLDGLRQYRADRETASLEGREPPRNAERMAAGLELQNGRYVAQFIGADPETMAAAFETELERLETE